MSTATLIPLLAAPRRVDVKAIDRELAELWRAAAESSQAERIALSRARTLTLVVYAPTPDAGARLAEVAAHTCQRHPARTIILIADPAAADLTAEVTAVCQVRRRNLKQICCEQVLIRTAPAAEGRIPSLVRQVILPDMPVVLYWPGPPPAERLFRHLGEIVDPVIVDTAPVPDGPAADGGARPDHAQPRAARGLVARAGTALRRVAGGTDALAGGAAFHPRRRAVAGDAGGPARPRHPRLPARGVARGAPRRGAPVHADRHR